MKAVVPEIAWHNKNPVFAVDIQLTANKGFYRAATAGGDSHVVVRLRVLCTNYFNIYINVFIVIIITNIFKINRVRAIEVYTSKILLPHHRMLIIIYGFFLFSDLAFGSKWS